MLEVANVFTKGFTREFYRLNAGFFMVVITLTFGFMSGVEHKALAQFFVASPSLSFIPIAVWIVYTLKVVFFNRQRALMNENNFLFCVSLLPYPNQFAAALQAGFTQLLPVILYAGFLTTVGLSSGMILSTTIIVSAVLVLLVFCSVLLLRALRTPVPEAKTSSLKSFIDKHTVRPLPWIYIVTVLRHEPFLFFGTKVFTGLLVYAVSQLYYGESYDGRLLAMATSIAAAGNFMILMQIQLFDFKYFLLMKGLPIGIFRRWLNVALITVVFIAPEVIMLVKYAPVALTDMIPAIAILPALSLCIYSILFLKFGKEEAYARLTFAIAMIHVVLILFKVPVIALMFFDVIVAWTIFRVRYYLFELPGSGAGPGSHVTK